MIDIALVAPSGAHAAMFPTRRNAAVADLNRLGARVTYPSVRTSDSSRIDALSRPARAGDAATRLQELEQAFAHPEVDLVMATIGGLTAVDLIERADFARLAESGRPLCGFSDISLLQLAGLRFGLRSLSGPMLMTQFGDRSGCDPFTWDHFAAALALVRSERSDLRLGIPPHRLAPHEPWGGPTEGVRSVRHCAGPSVIRPGTAEGPVLAGNIAAFDMLIETPWEPPLDGTLLGIEAAENQGAYDVARLLHRLRFTGRLSGVTGILVGRLTDNGILTDDELRPVLQELVPSQIPVVIGMPFGHVDPIVTIPLGARARLVAGDDDVSLILDGGVEDLRRTK